VSERGYTLAPEAATLPVGEAVAFRFRITGPDGKPVTRYERAHGKYLHLIVVRRDLACYLQQSVDAAISASVRYAYGHPDAVWPTIRGHAQEMDDDVMRRHIELYVNAFTEDYGREGEAAIRFLFDEAERHGILPATDLPLFWDDDAD